MDAEASRKRKLAQHDGWKDGRMAWYSFDHFQRASVSGAEEEFNPSGQESGLSGTVNFEITCITRGPRVSTVTDSRSPIRVPVQVLLIGLGTPGALVIFANFQRSNLQLATPESRTSSSFVSEVRNQPVSTSRCQCANAIPSNCCRPQDDV